MRMAKAAFGKVDAAFDNLECAKGDLRAKVPKRVFFVDALPRNTMGKVQKNLLRERYKTI